MIFITWRSTLDEGNDIITDQILRWKKKQLQKKMFSLDLKLKVGIFILFMINGVNPVNILINIQNIDIFFVHVDFTQN